MGPSPITTQCTGVLGMYYDACPQLGCDPEPAKNLAEVADIWERYC